ncbi:MAG: hypothetical protein ABIR48_03380 [Gammaproteobacteria bacterium]
MSHTEQYPILIKANDGATSAGALKVTVYEKRERLMRAARMLALYWMLALLSLPIFVAHWLLVPGFFIAGPVMAWLRYRVVERKDQVTGQCPVDKNDVTIPLEPSVRLPFWTYCPLCAAPLQLIEHTAP